MTTTTTTQDVGAAAHGAGKTQAARMMAGLTTPRLMSLGLVVLGLVLGVFWAVGTGVIFEAKSGVQTIGRDTAPSVVAAQQIRAALANIDSDAVDAAITGNTDEAWAAYEMHQKIFSDYLVSAAQNITYGEAERNPIVDIAAQAQVYSGLIGAARATMTASNHAAGAAIPPRAMELMHRASEVMNGKLMPAAAALNAANEEVLEATWESRKSAYHGDTFGTFGAGLPPLAILGALIVLVAARTRRKLNIGLLAATLVACLTVAWTVRGIHESSSELRVAKVDAFDSVRALWKTRATAFAANTDESYFLLDPSRKKAYGENFVKNIDLVGGAGFETRSVRERGILAAENFGNADCRQNKSMKSTFPGYLGDELTNVTFDYECREAVNALLLLSNYVDVDARIRGLENSGQHDAAIAMNIGTEPGQSDYAFTKLNQEIGLLIYINQMEFEKSVAKAAKSLAPLPWVLGAGCLLAWLLAWAGLRPRLREYRA